MANFLGTYGGVSGMCFKIDGLLTDGGQMLTWGIVYGLFEINFLFTLYPFPEAETVEKEMTRRQALKKLEMELSEKVEWFGRLVKRLTNIESRLADEDERLEKAQQSLDGVEVQVDDMHVELECIKLEIGKWLKGGEVQTEMMSVELFKMFEVEATAFADMWRYLGMKSRSYMSVYKLYMKIVTSTVAAQFEEEFMLKEEEILVRDTFGAKMLYLMMEDESPCHPVPILMEITILKMRDMFQKVEESWKEVSEAAR